MTHNWRISAGLSMLALTLQHPPAAAEPPSNSFVFVLDTERLILIRRGASQVVGRIDSDGGFLATHRYPLGATLSGPFDNVVSATFEPGRAVYDFRVGRLIKVEFNKDGAFVPEVGSRV